MSVTIGTIAGGTGLGSERQVIQTTSGDLWAFQYTGLNVLSTWVSQNAGVSWSAGTTYTLVNAHNSEGRNLAVAYKNISGIDVVHIALIYKVASTLGANEIRATISGTTITFHTLETVVSTPTGASTFYASSGIDFDSNNKIHFSNGYANGGNGDIGSSDSGADGGTSEQMTPVTWTSHVIDSSVSNESRSSYIIDLGSGNAGLIADNATATNTLTALDWHTWNGSAWNTDDGNSKVTGSTITAIDKNDWGAVAVSPTDIHVVYRNSSGNLIHRRYNGSNWVNGQVIPAQTVKAGGGVALASDGASVWLTVIDSASGNAIRYIRWTSFLFNDVADQWETWADGEGSSATRTFVGCAKDVVNQTLLAYWAEGTSFTSVALPAVSPPDPPGIITRDATSALGSGAGSATLAIAFTGTQPIAGDKIVVGFWASFGTSPTITSVKDNANVQNTFTLGSSRVRANTQGVWIYWLDLPANATWSGNYTITVTFSAAVTEEDGGALAYGNVQTGAPVATNNNGGTSTAATTGAVNSPTGNSLYFATLTVGTGANPATVTWSAPFTGRISQLNGSAQQVGSVGDVINQSGSLNAAITVDSSNWDATISVWPGKPSAINIAQVLPGPTWQRRYWRGLKHPIPGPLTSSGIVSNIVTATDTLDALSETPTRTAMAFIRTSPDSLAAISETSTRILGLPRSLSDSLAAISETALRILSLPRTAADSLSAMSDTATRAALALARSAIDNLAALIDAATEILSLPRTTTDNLDIMTDSASVSRIFIRTATDSLSALSDTVTRLAMSFIRTTTDNLSSLSDTATRAAQSFARSVSESLNAISDTATISNIVIRTATDNLAAITDTATRAAQGFIRTTTDNLAALSDTASRALQGFIRTATDTLNAISDTASMLRVIIRTATDNLSAISDVATRGAASFLRSSVDSLVALSDSASRVLSLNKLVTDSLGAISDNVTRLLTFARSASEALSGISDSASRATGLTRAATDNLASLSDSATRSIQAFLRSVVDNLPSLSDIVTNTGALTTFFVTSINRIRDGSFIGKARDGVLRVFGRDASDESNTRG